MYEPVPGYEIFRGVFWNYLCIIQPCLQRLKIFLITACGHMKYIFFFSVFFLLGSLKSASLQYTGYLAPDFMFSGRWLRELTYSGMWRRLFLSKFT